MPRFIYTRISKIKQTVPRSGEQIEKPDLLNSKGKNGKWRIHFAHNLSSS